MNRCILLLALVLAVFSVTAQPFYRDSAYIRQVNFPKADNKKITERYRAHDHIYLFSPMDVYNIFPADSVYQPYYQFDFEQYHILGRYTCRQCLLHCLHEEGRPGGCHRNACINSWVWVVRSNKKAFDTIPSRAERTTIDYPGIYDTIVQPATAADSGLAHWFTTSMGDCHARFNYAIVTDKYFPVTILLETSHYGGCRAARFDDMDISFTPRTGKQFYRKAEIAKQNDKRR